MIPRATYRLQFHAHFGFDDAAALAPYLAQLGVSHLYASPYLRARPGSLHGYDIVDHSQLNPELGDDASFRRMSAALKLQHLGQILDVVPNHMGVGGADNPLWLDVLEWGPGVGIRRLVRHRMGPRSPLLARESARTLARRSIWRGT
jgi:(1->4)-alpha-D-glucan 1-alpha-D-glucosylmutase